MIQLTQEQIAQMTPEQLAMFQNMSAAPPAPPPAYAPPPAAATPQGYPAAPAVDLNDREVRDYGGRGADFFPLEEIFTAIVDVEAITHLPQAAQGARYDATCTVVTSDNPQIRQNYQYAIPFKYLPDNSVNGQIKAKIARQNLRALCAVLRGQDTRSESFDGTRALQELVGTQGRLGRIKITQTVRQTEKGPRTNQAYEAVAQ